MKKIFALFLALCMMAAVLPVFADSVETGSETAAAEEIAELSLDEQLESIMGSEGTTEDKASGIITMIVGLKDRFAGNGNALSAVISSLLEKLKGLIQPGEEGLLDLLSGLKDKLAGAVGSLDIKGILSDIFGKIDLSGLNGIGDTLNGFFGGGKEEGGLDLSGLNGLGDMISGFLGGGEDSLDLEKILEEIENTDVSEDDGETLAETIERLNREDEAETGDGVPGKIKAESIEEFYGQWQETRFIFMGTEYDASEYNEGVYIGENTYYITEDGVKSEDYRFPETAELTLRDGILKVCAEGNWSTFVLTENGELALPSSSMTVYYKRVEE